MSAAIAGIDEVGRGCLAGPVFAAAVILPPRCTLKGLRDSKALSAAQREKLAPQIREQALAWAIGIASVEEIDHYNILHATGIAMVRAVNALTLAPAAFRVDGNWRPPLLGDVETLVGGDDLEPAIMAASIIAKVARDALMSELHESHPQYNWARNKGYGTAEHLAGLRLHGATAWHRRSFAPVGGRGQGAGVRDQGPRAKGGGTAPKELPT